MAAPHESGERPSCWTSPSTFARRRLRVASETLLAGGLAGVGNADGAEGLETSGGRDAAAEVGSANVAGAAGAVGGDDEGEATREGDVTPRGGLSWLVVDSRFELLDE